jgi:hypothetical protein
MVPLDVVTLVINVEVRVDQVEPTAVPGATITVVVPGQFTMVGTEAHTVGARAVF